ncbi:MAG: hypothetical protein ACPGUE_12060 [Marinomonas sp.]
MKVKAIEKGFYNKIMLPGEEFVIKDKKELGKWMEEVKEPKKAKAD